MTRDFKGEYVEFLKNFLDIKRPMKVVFDSGCGPAGSIVRDVFKDSVVQMTVINDKVDPDFSSRAPNPLLPGASHSCFKAMQESGAEIGIMFDADADRAIFVNTKGELIPAYVVTKLLSQVFKPPYVVDELVYESVRFLDLIPESNLIPSRIGAYFLKKVMKERGCTFGAENSGHYYFKDFFGLDSGIFTAIAVLNSLSRSKDTIEKDFNHEIITIEISTEGKDMPALLAKLEERYGKDAKHIEHRDGVSFIFDQFWANVRSSNTEPILRIIAGGSASMQPKLKEIENFVREN